jgi:hypothetical protein
LVFRAVLIDRGEPARVQVSLLFKERENDKLAELLTASGANLDSSDRAEMRGLLSGSEAAQDKLARIAPNVAHQIEQLVREAFVYAFDGAMLLCMAVSVAGVVAALLVASKSLRPQRTAGPTPESPTPGTGQSQRPSAFWRLTPSDRLFLGDRLAMAW